MPIPKNANSTWTFGHEGTTYTLAPIDAEVYAKAIGMARNEERQHEALVFIARNGGVRGWKNADETVERATAEDLKRLTFDECAACGDAVFARTSLKPSDPD